MAFNLRTIVRTGSSVDFREVIKNGAMLVDVRTPAEFAQNHIEGSTNWPMMELEELCKEVNLTKEIVLVCASGMRSGKAKKTLMNLGFEKVYNAGSWMSLQRKIKH